MSAETFMVCQGGTPRTARNVGTFATEEEARSVALAISAQERYDRGYVYRDRELIARYLHGSEVGPYA